ncbi:MAG: DUF4469 domain-containing protein [Treponema sp.]|nr:DUF4469 domain-containing protein [Treponema sp.]
MKQFELTRGSRTVSLYTNPFSDDESYVGRIKKNVITLENMIAHISENNNGISDQIIYHAANLLMDEVLRQIRLGNSVELLGAGTLYLKINGVVKSKNPGKADVPGFSVGFTPSKEVLEEASKVKVDMVTVKDTCAQINEIINTYDQSRDNKLFLGSVVRLKGSELKVAGVDSGIFFTPFINEEPVADEDKWIQVPPERIITNMPKTLEFYVPAALEQGRRYSIVLKNTVSHGKVLKKPSVAYSVPILIGEKP